MHGLERITEFVVAGWLLINTLGMVLVAFGVARRYANAALARRREDPTAEVAFDSALSLTE